MESIKIVSNNIQVNNECLKKIIIDEWGALYKFYHDLRIRDEKLNQFILDDIADCATDLWNDIEKKAQEELNNPNIKLDIYDKYPKSDIRSIGFRVLNFLEFAWIYSYGDLLIDDIPFIFEFLDTTPDNLLEAWKKWENYWDRKIEEEEGWLALMTSIDGGLSEAIKLLVKIKKEFEGRTLFEEIIIPVKHGGERMAYYYRDGSFVQLKIRNGIPIMIIIDAVKKNKEKITFKVHSNN